MSFSFAVKFIHGWLSWNYTKVFLCVCFHKCLQIHYYELVGNIFANICESFIIGIQLDQKYLVEF
jgi:hypothetical protein